MPLVEFRMGGGLNTKADPTQIGDDQLQRAVGCRFDVAGAVSSELSHVLLKTFSTGAINGIVDGYRGNGIYHYVKTGTRVYEEETTLVGGTSAWTGGRLTGASYNDWTYLTDGSGLKRWDGTTLEDAGLEAPTEALVATAATGTGGGMIAGNYRYFYTFFNGVAESNFSPMGLVTVEDGDDGVNLTSIAVGGATVTARRVYRSDVAGKAKYFLTEIADNTTTTYTDTSVLAPEADEDSTPGDDPVDVKSSPSKISNKEPTKFPPSVYMRSRFPSLERVSEKGDSTKREQVVMSNLGALADWTDHTPPPSDITGVVFHQEQFFGISGQDVVFSRVAEPEHWPVFNRFRPGRRSAEQVLALLPLGPDIMIYTDSNIYRLSTSSSSFEPPDIRLETLESPVGIASEQAVCAVALGGSHVHVMASGVGVYICDGRSVIEVGLPVDALFNDFEADYRIERDLLSTIIMASQRDRVWMSYNDGSRTLMMDFQNPQEAKYSINNYGYASIHRDKRTQRLLAGGRDGKLYEIVTSSKGEASISWVVKTKEFVFGAGLQSVAFEEVIIDADLAGGDTTVIVATNTGRVAVTKIIGVAGRQRHRLHLPAYMRGNSIDVQVSSRARYRRHIYAIGFNVSAESEP